MTADRTVTALFSASSVTHLLSVATSGSGSVTGNPSGISCGQTCSTSFAGGTSVVLTASADRGFVFTGWQGDCSGTASCTLTMTADRTAAALTTASPVTHVLAGAT